MISLPRTERVDSELRKAIPDENEYIEIAREIDAGTCELWRVGKEGLLLTRVESRGKSRELVLVAAVGTCPAGFMASLLSYAKSVGTASVRVHSSRPGMVKYLARHSFDVAETVYRRYL